jgi:hypothetical protein
LADYDKLTSAEALSETPTVQVPLGDNSLFRLFIGKRVLRRDVSPDTDKVPVFSANVFQPMGYIDHSNIADFEHPSILWGIDGNFEFNLIPPGKVFATTDHCGLIQILNPGILPEYLLYALHLRRIQESFDRSFRASLANMGRFVLTIPVTKSGAYDEKAQRLLAARFAAGQETKARLQAAKEQLDSVFLHYLCGFSV